MEFVDFAGRRRGPSLGLIFPGWAKGEAVAFYSPHDDDVVLGAGYLVQAVRAQGGIPLVLIFCRGDAGYSTPEEKRTIVARRKKEAVAAYRGLGVGREDIVFFDVPDFGLMPRVGRRGGGRNDVFDRLISFVRAKKISRVVFASGHREHWDHTAVFYEGIYTTPQAGDPILADLGPISPVKSFVAYAVWSDFEPSADRKSPVRADKGLLADAAHEHAVRAALAAFASQRRIMNQTAAIHRERRRFGTRYLELYQTIPVRSAIGYDRYFALLRHCRRMGARAEEKNLKMTS